MHELGHNFNSPHTHDTTYSPAIDTCGTSCPAGLPLAKSSTIMSYCHGCSGGYSNMDYTFGGKYNTGPRGAVTSYTRSPLQGTISTDPQRVNARMWNHVASGSCTNIYLIGSAKPTGIPTAKPTGIPTGIPTSVPSATPTTGNPNISSKPTQSPTTGAPTTGAPSRSPTPPPTSFPSRAPTCIATGGECTSAASCCSNVCPSLGKDRDKCGSPAPPASASPTRQPTVFGATGAPTKACTGGGGACTTAASCCSNKCHANGANAGTCAA